MFDLVARELDLTLDPRVTALGEEAESWHRLDLTLFDHHAITAEQDRPDFAAERADLKTTQARCARSRLHDETGIMTKMVRYYGRSPCGKRLVASVPHGHWKIPTLVPALRIDRTTAPYAIDGALTDRR